MKRGKGQRWRKNFKGSRMKNRRKSKRIEREN